MSIRGKLTLIMMGISGAAILLTVAAITLYLLYDMRQARIRDLEVSAAIMADRNRAALTFLDSEQAQSNLQVFAADADIVIACLYDEAGVLFAGYANPLHEPYTCSQQVGVTTHFTEKTLLATKDIMTSQGQIGSVQIVSDMGTLESAVRRILLISLAITGVVFTFALLLIVYFQRSISVPIVKLMQAVRTIARDKDYSIRAPQSDRRDEIGALARAFNRMIEEVEQRDMDLLEVNDNLERMVWERTQDLEDAKKRAEFASEAKSEFLRNMSHEFRTPLHAMTSFSAYGLREAGGTDTETIRGYFSTIQASAERLNKLVNEVLNLSRLESGQQSFLMQRGNLEGIIDHCVKTLQPLTKDKDITLTVSKPEIFAECIFDHDRITQVLTNILGNAVKFTPHGKRIWLEYEESGRGPFGEKRPMVTVSVHDEGVGIPEQELNRIFESFVQSSRTNQGAGGTGLGLAISRNIMRAHEGKIFASNNENGGATFTFMFPRDLKEGEIILDIRSVA